MQKLPSTKFAHGDKMPSARKAGPGRYHQQGYKTAKNKPKAPMAQLVEGPLRG